MINKYMGKLEKIEFIITYGCTGRCKHCSEGSHTTLGECINARLAADAVRRVAAEYDIKTVMTFGGEPLIYPDAVFEIMSAAREMNIPRRQLITNGYFSNDEKRVCEVARMLASSGVNDLLLSVDAFHQEYIPIGAPLRFAVETVRCGIPTRLSPAWLVSPEADNPYNEKTRDCISKFRDTGVTLGNGNVVFPEGNAKVYLSEYFTEKAPENPYREDPCQIKCLSFEPNGDVLGDNFYRRDVMDIIRNYSPKEK